MSNNFSALFNKVEHANSVICAVDRRIRAILHWSVADASATIDHLRWAAKASDVMRSIVDDWHVVYWRCERFATITLRDPDANAMSETTVETSLIEARAVRAKFDELGQELLAFRRTGAAANHQYEAIYFDMPDEENRTNHHTLQDAIPEMELAVQRAIEALMAHETVLKAWPQKPVHPE